MSNHWAPIVLADDVFIGEHRLRIEAGIEPAGSRWMPLPGRMSRWWFEVDTKLDGELCRMHWWEHDSGAFSLHRCIHKARKAMDRVEQLVRENPVSAVAHAEENQP
jgi:hypothetical protein